jgi:hypothetical protein
VIDLDRLPYVIPKKNARLVSEMGVSGSTHSYHVIKGLTLLKCKTIDVYTTKIKKNKFAGFQWILSYLTERGAVKFFICAFTLNPFTTHPICQ